MTDTVQPTVLYTGPCPSCGFDVTWHARQFEQPTPKCTRPTCRTDQIVEK